MAFKDNAIIKYPLIFTGIECWFLAAFLRLSGPENYNSHLYAEPREIFKFQYVQWIYSSADTVQVIYAYCHVTTLMIHITNTALMFVGKFKKKKEIAEIKDNVKFLKHRKYSELVDLTITPITTLILTFVLVYSPCGW